MTVVDDKWNYCRKLKYDTRREFEPHLLNLKEYIQNHSTFRFQNYEDNGQNHDNELKILEENNKQLRREIETKVEKFSQQETQYQSFKEDQKLLSQEIKDTHEAFLMAKKYYKKFLKLYYTIESRNGDQQTIFFQFFTEAKKESEKYSIRLFKNTKTDCYELLGSKPKLDNLEELKKMLRETNDVPSVICCIRQAFMKIKTKKA